MNPTNCLNCATLLTADDHYCPTCGQKTNTHRLSMSHIWHDLTHAITHTDKGFFYTIKELFYKPGIVAREYLAGKRKKYFNPFSLLVIILGVYILANSIFKPYSPGGFTGVPERPGWIKTESQRQKYDKIVKRRIQMGEFMNKRINIVLFVSTPFIAFILWLFYKRRYNYAEHLSTMAYVNSFISITTIFLFAPLMYFIKDPGVKSFVYIIMMASHVFYLAFMYYGLLGYKTATGYLKTFGVSVVAIIAWAIFSMGIGMLYIMSGIF
jgi:RNA polymerase subunit RPABC4/transcription elongation factor Spt4